MKNLKQLEQTLVNQGHTGDAQRICRHSCHVIETSMNQLVKLRRHVNEMAELILEMSNSDDADSLLELVTEVQVTAEQAFVTSADGKKAYEDLSQELCDICLEMQGRQHAAQKEAEDHTNKSKQQNEESTSYQNWAIAHGGATTTSAVGTGVSATATTGAVVMTSVMSLAASTGAATGSVAGLAMTAEAVGGAVTAATVSGSGLMASGAAGAIFLGPPAWIIGAAVTLFFGAMTIRSAVKSYQAQKLSSELAKKARAAEDEAVASREAAEKAGMLGKSAADTSHVLDYHKGMWSGIAMSADEVKFSLQQLVRAQGSSARVMFKKRVNKFGENLIYFVQAIDKYLYWLSKTDYFPPNLNIRTIIGVQNFNKIQNELGFLPVDEPLRAPLTLSSD